MRANRRLAALPMAAALAAVSSAELPAQEPGPDNFVLQLAHPEMRDAARQGLLRAGKAALPAIEAFLRRPPPKGGAAPRVVLHGGRNDNHDADIAIAAELLAVLAGIGIDAGPVLPALVAAAERGMPFDEERLLTTLAEIAPGSDTDAGLLSGIALRQTSGPAWLWHRLAARLQFPRNADLATLQRLAGSRRAFRAELAVQLLGRRGPAAAGALPLLRAMLDRPDPRIVPDAGTVPLRAAAAAAMLAIGADGDLAAAARAVLAGGPAPAPAGPQLPERLQQRIDELIAELAQPQRRDAARQNLAALGRPAVPALVEALRGDEQLRNAAAATLALIGPAAAEAAPELLLRCGTDSVAAVEALAATAPWCRDVIALAGWFSAELPIGSPLLWVRWGNPLEDQALRLAQARCGVAIDVDPEGTVDDLLAMLDAPSLLHRERALQLLAQRRSAAMAALPRLQQLLREPPAELRQFGGMQLQPPVELPLRRLAAEAVLAIAPAGDVRRQQAQQVLGASR